MKYKKILCVFIAILILTLIIFPNSINAKEYSLNTISGRVKLDIEKLDPDTIEPVYIFLKNTNQDDVYKYIYDNYGIDGNIFDDMNLYYSKVVNNILVENGKSIKQVLQENNVGYKELKLSSKDSPFSKEFRKKINKEIIKTTHKFLRYYRKGVKAVNDLYLSDFIDDNSNYIESIKMKPQYGSFILANIKLRNIKQLLQNSLVTFIDYFDNIEPKCESWNALQVTKSDSINGIGSIYYNDGMGYDGTDINIGVIEANSGVYDENNYNLSDANITLVDNPSINTYYTSSHATKVTSLICGKKTTISGRTYEGAAKGANIYQIPSKYISDLYEAIDILVSDYDIDIINYSAGAYNNPGYTSFDQAIDNIIEQSKISFVKSAGNQGTSGYITSPGKAFNAITVGNIKSESNNVALLPPYNVYSLSSSLEAYYLPNKPDIVVPASGLYLPVDANSSVYIGSATSWAAPIATGIAAQIMQDNPSAIVNFNALKSYLTCGANNDLLTGTTISYGSLNEESGAGLVNAKESLSITEFGNEVYGAWISSAVAPTQYYDKATLHLYADNRVRIAVSFRKAENIPVSDYYGNNIDIRLVDVNSDFCVSAESLNNNLEIIDAIVPHDGNYKIQMKLTDSILSPGSNDNLRFWMCWNVFY